MTSQTQRTIKYSKRNDKGSISISGICDIFEASNLKDVFVQAIAEKGVSKLSVDCKDLARIDTSTVQLLVSLKKTAESGGKTLTLLNLPEPITKYLDFAGVKL